MKNAGFHKLVLLSLALAALACAAKQKPPNLGAIYSRAASYHGPDRNPVILIPGLLGSKLVEESTNRVVWGAFDGGFANPQKPDGARLLALPMHEGARLDALRDSVIPAGALDHLKIKVLGLPFEIGAYVNILGALGIGGYRDEALGLSGAVDYGDDHYTCFQFDYDWRRDNVENARRLHHFIEEKRAYVQAENARRFDRPDDEVKFDIVAHSMGSLMLRYYLRYGDRELTDDPGSMPVTWDGAKSVERVVLVAPPNAGSAETILQLVDGRKFGPIFPKYEPAILGTWPASYQLLPRARHGALVDGGDTSRVISDFMQPEFWAEKGWGLLDPKQDKVLRMLLPEVSSASRRRAIALDHLSKNLSRAQQFMQALDAPAAKPPSLSLYLVAGDALPTVTVVAVDPRTGAPTALRKESGDGTVARASALMDERASGKWAPRLISPIEWSQVSFVFSEHLAMTKDPAFTDNILYFLIEHPVKR